MESSSTPSRRALTRALLIGALVALVGSTILGVIFPKQSLTIITVGAIAATCLLVPTYLLLVFGQGNFTNLLPHECYKDLLEYGILFVGMDDDGRALYMLPHGYRVSIGQQPEWPPGYGTHPAYTILDKQGKPVAYITGRGPNAKVVKANLP